MLITRELVVNKSKQRSELLIDNLMLALTKLFCQPASKLRLQKRPKKKAQIKAEHNKPVVLEKNSVVNV